MTGHPVPSRFEQALREDGVETSIGVDVTALTDQGVTLSDRSHIETGHVIWAAGMQAAPRIAQVPEGCDGFGRRLVDRDLRVQQVAVVFANGDAAEAACDDDST
jgi:NADH dehydrogenase